MKTRARFAAIAAGAALLAACGSSGGSGSSATTAAAAPASEAPAGSAAAGGAPAVTVTKSSLGDILTDAKGFTVYGFTADTNGKSTCTGGCATAWPPVTVAGTALPAGLDAKVFSVVEGPPETYQLVAGKWPLYTFSGDKAPGDTNGQGSGGTWFVVAPDGSLIKG